MIPAGGKGHTLPSLDRLIASLKEQGPCFMIIIAGNFKNDLEKLVEDPKVAGGCLWRWLRSTGSIRETFRATGTFGGEAGGTDLFNLMAEYINITAQAKRRPHRAGSGV
jgi:hypothetical protein